jgi:mono/diheme cytochrome c family protein
MRRRTKIAIGVIVAVVVLGITMLLSMLRNGFSSLDEPSGMEAFMATTMRRMAVPADLEDAKNPLPLTPELLTEGRAHFADHCAGCHGNDGKGQTSMGPKFYPKVPDMTKDATQSQSDGALFATIENGIRLTGMPAFGNGTAESAYGSWGLVHFVRHLPKLTPAEIAEMEKLNPKSPEECMEAAFLAGDEEGSATPPAPAHSSTPHGH